jgi:hypothetical protein
VQSNDYHFTTHWRVQGTVQEVREILGDAEGLSRWWPAVYLQVHTLDPGDERGLGRVVDLHTKGWLPYTLHWRFQVTEVREDGFSLEAWGDFVGRGVWTFESDGQWTNITYDWKISAEKPLIRTFSPLFKRLFEANHRWAMAKGEESLRLELARRHARTPEQLALVPPPPAPTSVPVKRILLGAGATALLGAAVARTRKRQGSA